MSARLAAVLIGVTAVYFALNLLFVSDLQARDDRAESDWQSTLNHARHHDRNTLVAGGVPKYGTAPPPLRREEPRPAPVALASPAVPTHAAGSPTPPPAPPAPQPASPPAGAPARPSPPPPPPPPHLPPLPPPPAGAPDTTNAGVGKRPLLLYRTRFREPSGFSQEAIDFVRGLSKHYYVGLHAIPIAT